MRITGKVVCVSGIEHGAPVRRVLPEDLGFNRVIIPCHSWRKAKAMARQLKREGYTDIHMCRESAKDWYL